MSRGMSEKTDPIAKSNLVTFRAVCSTSAPFLITSLGIILYDAVKAAEYETDLNTKEIDNNLRTKAWFLKNILRIQTISFELNEASPLHTAGKFLKVHRNIFRLPF